MRFLLKVNIPVECGNAAAKAGKLDATIQMTWPSNRSAFFLAANARSSRPTQGRRLNFTTHSSQIDTRQHSSERHQRSYCGITV